MSWTSPDDVVDSWIGDDAPDDDLKLQTWIDRAEREVRFRVPDLQTRLDVEAAQDPVDETPLLDTVVDVVVAMVSRKFRNPDGTRQRSVTTGPFSEQQTYGGANPGELEMLDSEIDRLSGDGSGSTRAFVVDTIPAGSRFSESYVAPNGWFGWW